MDSRPGTSCFKLKFSSSNARVPYIHVDPVPSPLRKSPPWHMNPWIYRAETDLATRPLPYTPDIEVVCNKVRTYHAVELGPLVALRLPLRVPRLAGAELAEVLGRLGDGVLEELKGHAAERRACLPSAIMPTSYQTTACPTRVLDIDIRCLTMWTRLFSLAGYIPPSVMSKKTLRPSAPAKLYYPQCPRPKPAPAPREVIRRSRSTDAHAQPADDVPRPSSPPQRASHRARGKGNSPAGESGPRRRGTKYLVPNGAPGHPGGICN